MSPRYPSPAAFRRAVTDRLRRIARPHGPWQLTDLQRQFAYDRLLARLYLSDDQWIVKGATALIARQLSVRHTIDVDVLRATTRALAEQDLRAAVRRDVGDWFTFDLGRATPVADGGNAVRLPVTATIGATPWARFHVDLVTDNVRMTGTPEEVPPLLPDLFPELAPARYRAYPLVDHIADKIVAMLERHGPARLPSTRYKDLVDLVALTGRAQVHAEAQRRARTAQVARRELAVPLPFDVPDHGRWEPGYAAEARRAHGCPAHTPWRGAAGRSPVCRPAAHRHRLVEPE